MGIRSVIGWVVSAVGSYFGQGWAVAVGQGMIARDNYLEQKKAKRRALQDYNNSLQDRLEMLDLQPNYPRTLVLGRVRYVEGVRRRWTSGANEEKLTMIVSFAGHEIDAFEQWYLDDKPVTLDANGYVQEAPYYRGDHAEPTTSIDNILISELGEAVAILSPPPAATSNIVCAWVLGTGDEATRGTATVAVGTVGPDPAAYISGAPPGAIASVVYSSTSQLGQYVRIRPYLGAAGQNVGAALAAEYPGKITSADKFAGIALAVVDVYYSPDVFPQGRPNITAVMRGAKCYDPRTTLTVWTENPALHALHYATWAHGWALQAADYRAADIVAAADVCDVSTVFTLRASGGGTSTATLPRYRSGITIAANADHAETMDAIMVAMAGQHGWAGGVWRMRAGTMATPVASITQDWLMVATSAGQRSDDPVITAVQTVPRVRRVNRVAGSCVDPAQRYQLLPFPAVEDAVLIAAEGERQADVELQAVNHIAHAQHLASIAIRQAQAGLRLELLCGEQAATLELLDVVQVTMPRYGFTAKTFEVVGWTWSQAAAYKVQLAEITADIFTPLAELTGRDPAPDSDIRAPWDVEAITGVAVTSGTAALTDGSIITRTRVDWTPATGASVRTGGQIEVQYAEANALPDGDWPSWLEAGDAAYATLPGLMAGRVYVFRVRAVQTLPLVRGAWSTVVMHQVADVPVVAGGAGQYKDFVFKRSAAAPATPTGATPAGWFDSPPAADGNPLWTSVADKEADGTLIGTWSAPVQIEGAGIEVEYSVNGSTLWHSTFVLGDLYARHRVEGSVTWEGPWKIVGEDGADGAAAQTLFLSSTGFAFVGADAAATTVAGPDLTFTANLQNVSGTATFVATAYNAADVSLGTITLGGADNTRTLTAAQFTNSGAWATWRVVVTATLGALSDTMTVYRGNDGTDTVQAMLANEAHTLPTTTAGVVTYTGSGSTIRVFEGVTELQFTTGVPGNGQWTATGVGSNVTAGAISLSGLTGVMAQHSAMTADTAQVTVTITGKTATGASFPTITKVQSLAKSNQGAAGVGKTCYITSNQALAVGFDAAKSKIATANNYFNLFSNVVNISGTKTYAWTATTFGTGTSTTASSTNWSWTKESAYTEYPVKIQLVVSENGVEVASDTVFVTTTLDGTGGISAILSNEVHVFPASATGAVSSYTGSGTELRVYEGATALTYDGSGTANGTWTFSTATTNITRGAITDSGTFATIGQHSGVADGTDTASIVYTITGKTAAGASIAMTKVQTFAKSKAGSTGATGGTGSTGSTGQSNHRVYKAVTIGSPPATPGTTTSGATPATWSATPLTLSTGQEQYQSDGTTPAGSTTTTWGTPYPSYLKVGNLSAISADLGTVTAGNVNTSGYVQVEGSNSVSVPFLLGTASMAVAVAGNTAAGATSGVYGRSSNFSGAGVLGINTNTTNGDGVYGEGKQGVTGIANSANGSGVFGYGAFSANSVAVEALANNSVSGTRAMQATADAAGQIAVKAISASGIALDVVGTAQVSGLCTLADLRINKAPTTGAVAAGFTAIVSNKPAGSVAGSEAKWLALNLNGTTYYVPVWT